MRRQDVYNGFAEAVAFTETPEDRSIVIDWPTGEHLPEGIRKAIDEFLAEAVELIERSGLTGEQVGHNLWLTAQRHGTGFWDCGLGTVGDRLTELAHASKIAGVDILLPEDGDTELEWFGAL